MVRFTKILILILFFCSSCKQAHKKELTPAEKEKLQLQDAEIVLNDDKEKLALLATIKQIPYDTLYSILRDYYFKTDYRSDATFEQAITYTAQRHNFPKWKIANMIFSFKYEMITRDDILEEDAENKAEMEDHQSDNY